MNKTKKIAIIIASSTFIAMLNCFEIIYGISWSMIGYINVVIGVLLCGWYAKESYKGFSSEIQTLIDEYKSLMQRHETKHSDLL